MHRKRHTAEQIITLVVDAVDGSPPTASRGANPL